MNETLLRVGRKENLRDMGIAMVEVVILMSGYGSRMLVEGVLAMPAMMVMAIW